MGLVLVSRGRMAWHAQFLICFFVSGSLGYEVFKVAGCALKEFMQM